MERNSPESAYSSAKLGQRLLRWWGFLFRAILISGIGLGAYLFADPPSIADRAISSLTLRDISDNIFAYGIAFGCLLWFLSFPSESDADRVLSYEDWGQIRWLHLPWLGLGDLVNRRQQIIQAQP